MKAISIIRQRGQLTIPGSIRSQVSWVTLLSAVSISVVKPDEIIIKPHQKGVDWDKIWVNIRKSRAIRGKYRKSAQEILLKDRVSH